MMSPSFMVHPSFMMSPSRCFPPQDLQGLPQRILTAKESPLHRALAQAACEEVSQHTIHVRRTRNTPSSPSHLVPLDFCQGRSMLLLRFIKQFANMQL